jgi:hypothetical protein
MSTRDTDQPKRLELLFAYNADSGLFNAMADTAHKVFSPQTYACNLCKVTYGLMTEKRAWRRFIEDLDVDALFLHRDELRQRFPKLDIPLPAVLRRSGDQAPEVCIAAEALNRCQSIDDLTALVRDHCLT